jgi:putative acetyltransferase
MLIRAECSEDVAAIDHVNHEAFDSDVEARLVKALRDERAVIASLVAVDEGGRIVGHILFSSATVLTASHEMRVASLAPMAVIPARQRTGIGSMLVIRGLQECKRAGYRAAIVVGHPRYYPRFGFSSALVANVHNPFAKGDAFMGFELAHGSLSDLDDGQIVYPDAYKQL